MDHAGTDHAEHAHTAPEDTAHDHGMMDHGGMEQSAGEDPAMATLDHGAHGAHGGNAAPLLASDGSGTSRVPGYDGGHHGLHVPLGGQWLLMVHGYASVQYTAISGPRGDDKLYSLSHVMAIASRDTGWGRIQLRSAFSFDRLSMGPDGYPSLFTTGEVAFGQPLVDRQHPHDLFTELSARVDVDVAPGATLFVYGGPAAEPALGPASYLHRGSAKYNPDPPITHHWFDSTHLSFGVVTAGYAGRRFQIEGSGFRGREPDARRFDIETPQIDSWSLRATWNPSPYWSLQVSTGHLVSVEETHPDENEQRTTASVAYADGRLSAFVGFAAKDRMPGRTITAWLAEANWDIDDHNNLFGRIENVAIDELFADPASPLHDQPFRVTKLQAGYAYRLPLTSIVGVALGGTVAVFAKPDILDAAYGQTPVGGTVFMRLSLGL